MINPETIVSNGRTPPNDWHWLVLISILTLIIYYFYKKIPYIIKEFKK